MKEVRAEGGGMTAVMENQRSPGMFCVEQQKYFVKLAAELNGTN